LSNEFEKLLSRHKIRNATKPNPPTESGVSVSETITSLEGHQPSINPSIVPKASIDNGFSSSSGSWENHPDHVQ